MPCSTSTAWSKSRGGRGTGRLARRCRPAPRQTISGAPIENLAITAFELLFQERGLPRAIRSDNGVPFASPNALFNLSKLSVWWLRLGIAIERIKPGHPQQNGRHKRMHLTLKKEATRPPGMNSLQQQARFDDFVQEFNTERPHEALAIKCPAEIYSASSRPYSGLPDLTYPLHDRDVLVTDCGRICTQRKRVNISTVLAGQRLGIKEVDDGIWIVSFMHYDLGFIDLEQKNPSTTPSAQGCHPCLRCVLLPMSPVRTFLPPLQEVGFEPLVPRFAEQREEHRACSFGAKRPRFSAISSAPRTTPPSQAEARFE